MQQDDRGVLALGGGALDMGTCPYTYGALTACAQSPPDGSADTSFFNGLSGNAYTATCAAICASLGCQEYSMAIAGPVPPGTGCCNQVAGFQAFNFSVWTFNPPHVDYNLVPTQLIASSDPQFRYLANNNRVLLGVLVQQTRWATGACESARFASIDDQCQLSAAASEPFGADPSFVVSSVLYQPGANASDYYGPDEISQFGIPFGFFPDAPGKARADPGTPIAQGWLPAIRSTALRPNHALR